MQKDVMIAAAAGLISAFFAMGYLTGRPSGVIFSFISTLPLFMMGLMTGIVGALVSGAVGLAAVAIAQGLMAGLVFGFNGLLPVCLVTHLALKNQVTPDQNLIWYPGGYIVSWLAVVFTGAFLLWAVMVSNEGVLATVESTLEEAFSIMWPQWQEESRTLFSGQIARIFPASTGIVWILMSVAGGVIAQKMLIRLKRNIRPLGSLAVLELPYWINYVLIGGAIVALIGSGDLEYIGINLTIVLTVPYFFLGLAVVHMFSRKVSYPGTLLAAFYICTAFFGWPLVMIVALGMIEQVVGVRRFFTTPDDWEF